MSVGEFLIATSKKRGYQQNDKKPTTLTANAAAVNPRQQQVKDGGGHVVIGQLLMEIWVGADFSHGG